MGSLIDSGATDPFVSIDAGRGALVVEVIIEAEGHSAALAGGAALIDGALRAAGVEDRSGEARFTARTEELVPA